MHTGECVTALTLRPAALFMHVHPCFQTNVIFVSLQVFSYTSMALSEQGALLPMQKDIGDEY